MEYSMEYSVEYSRVQYSMVASILKWKPTGGLRTRLPKTDPGCKIDVVKSPQERRQARPKRCEPKISVPNTRAPV